MQFCRGARARWFSLLAVSRSQPEPSEQDGGGHHDERLQNELARDGAVRAAQWRPEKTESVRGERLEERDAQRVGRESIEAAMREQREEEYETGPPLPPKPDGRDDHGGDKRKRERMRDGATGERRRIGELQRRPEHVDIRQRRAGRIST